MIIYIVQAGDELKPFVATQHRVDGEMVETTKENPLPSESKIEDESIERLNDVVERKIYQWAQLYETNKRLRQLIDESYKKE